jgi:hypothetical protein
MCSESIVFGLLWLLWYIGLAFCIVNNLEIRSSWVVCMCGRCLVVEFMQSTIAQMLISIEIYEMCLYNCVVDVYCELV